MEERKLNFNAPILSVRRFSMASSSFSVEEDKKNPENSIFQNESEFIFDQVTESVAVPFHWEFIPGRSKNGHDELENKLPIQSHKASITSKFFQNFKGDDQRENSLGNERESEDLEKHDSHADVSESVSCSDSLSLYNFSVSGLSGSDGPDLKPSGTFSIDPQTLAFTMARFLPAASAVAINTANYVSRKQLVELPEKPRNQNFKFSTEQIESNMDVVKEKDERDVGDDECENSCSVLTERCSLLNGLCFENSIGLLNRLAELKINPPAEIGRLACVRPPSPNLKKFPDEHKLGVGSPKLLELKSAIGDLISRSRSSPLRNSKGASSYRVENHQSFKVPKANMLDSREKSIAVTDCELVPGELDSDSERTEIDKRLRVDSVNIGEISSSSSNFPKSKRKAKFTGYKIETRKVIEGKKETTTVESHSRQGNSESPNAGESNHPNAGESNHSELPSSIMDEQYEPEPESLQSSKSRNEDNQKHGKTLEIKSNSHRPPPLPKSPPESWLRRTLPSISSENLSSRSIVGNRRQSKRQNPKISSAETSKWETIVKTWNRPHDHLRYSEELLPRVSQHYNS